MSVRELLWDMDDEYEALKRRAKRNFRYLSDELRAILAEALREEVEALRREKEAQRERTEEDTT